MVEVKRPREGRLARKLEAPPPPRPPPPPLPTPAVTLQESEDEVEWPSIAALTESTRKGGN